MANIVNRINVQASLKGLEVGESLTMPFRRVTPLTIRANASRLRSTLGMDFKISQSSVDCKTTVKRIK